MSTSPQKTAAVGLAWSGGAATVVGAVIAEGVESPEDLAALRDLGVDAAQGYSLGRPSGDPNQVRTWTDRPGYAQLDLTKHPLDR